MSEPTENENVETSEKKKGIGSRIVGWIIPILIMGLILKFIIGLQSDKKEKFVEGVRSVAISECAGQESCTGNVKTHFEQCFEANHTSHKTGKYNRKYDLDKPGFDSCLKNFLASK